MNLIVRASSLVLLVGCKSEINPAYCAAHAGDPRCPDGGVLPTDGMIDLDSFVHPEAGAQTCFGATGSAYEICLTSLPTSTADISNAVINTDPMSPQCFPTQPVDWTNHGQPDACFVIGTDVTISNTSHAQGSRPLVVLATGTITLDGSLDVSSKRGQPAGAGHDSALCGAFAQAPDSSNMGAGGGAGAAFMTKGGDGGTGNGGAAVKAGHSAEADTIPPVILRGGCPGQAGGNGDQSTGTPGAGGGAMYLVSGKTFTLGGAGVLAASGAGASSGGHHSGGSGGGSGGMIVLYAGTSFNVTTSAKLIANGGGGASGLGGTGGGQSGSDGSSTSPTTVATGGGNGGGGFADTTMATSGTAGGNGIGGGGGGGGAGYIQANGTLALSASPNVTVH